jgi:diguanylate cyclase (GGDEF)-like protein
MSSRPPPRAPRWGVLAAAAAIAVLAALQIAAEVRFASRRLGIGYVDAAQGGLELTEVAPGSPAARAGLAVGDRLLSLAGQPLRDGADFDRVVAGIPARTSLPFGVSRAGHAFDARLDPGMPPELGALALSIVVVALYVLLGVLAATRGGEDRRARLLAAFAFAVAFEVALPARAPDGAALVAVAVAFALVSGLQFGLELHLASMIPTESRWLARRPGWIRLPYAFGLGLGLFAAAAAVAEATGVAGATAARALADQLLGRWLLLLWALAVAGIVGWRAVHHPEPRGRHQAGLVLLGLSPWVLIVVYEELRRFAAGAAPVSDAVWSLALLAYPVAIFAAIFGYRLFDLEWVVKRSFVYGALTTLLVLVFFALVGAGGALFARQFDGVGQSVWLVSAATLVLGLLFNPLRLRLERLIDRKIFPERGALRSRLVALAGELPSHGKLPRMGEHLARELARIFGVEPVTVWISAPPQGQLVELASAGRAHGDVERTALIGAEDPAIRRLARDPRPTATAVLAEASPAIADRLREARTELAVPLVSQGRVVGLLLVGPKRDGARFVAEELELLTLVAHHVTTVFENARLFDSATFEGLTGLFRREAILEILEREWSRAQRYDRPLAVAIADLDLFKRVNDRFGHLGGDVVLQRVAAELRGLLRETDFLGRFGGEEFLVVLPETTVEGARSFAEKVRRRVEELEIRMDCGASVRVTASIGVASRDESRGGDSRSRGRALIAAADEALYAAKHAGRNRVEVAAGVR